MIKRDNHLALNNVSLRAACKNVQFGCLPSINLTMLCLIHGTPWLWLYAPTPPTSFSKTFALAIASSGYILEAYSVFKIYQGIPLSTEDGYRLLSKLLRGSNIACLNGSEAALSFRSACLCSSALRFFRRRLSSESTLHTPYMHQPKYASIVCTHIFDTCHIRLYMILAYDTNILPYRRLCYEVSCTHRNHNGMDVHVAKAGLK